MTITELFESTIAQNASDLHLLAATPPVLRIDGVLQRLNSEPLSKEQINELILPLLTENQQELFAENKSLDFSYGYGGGAYGDKGRFRINVYFQRGTAALAARLLPPRVKTIDELNLPQIVHRFPQLRQGFVLVTGPTGHGKSTTLAAIINEINMSRGDNILTIEDPIEYMYPPGKSIVSQRELGLDTLSWHEALKSALREDPDVVLIGEMRDTDSIASAMTIAETGHLVFSTLHTNSASQTIDRIIDSFPEHQQNQIRIQLAGTIAGIISQRLIPKIEGGRVVATEVLMGTQAVKSTIRDGKTHLLDSIIETSKDDGMILLEHSLSTLVKEGAITLENANAYAQRPGTLSRLIG